MKKKRIRKGRLAIAVLLAIAVIVGVPTAFGAFEKVEPIQSKNISIVCAGDAMVHMPQVQAAYDSSTGAYDFGENFTEIKPYIDKADLALVNVETTFAGEPYSGFPTFSAPDEFAYALKDVGFDVSIVSNNHIADKGTSGYNRTLEVLGEAGFDIAGGRTSTEEPTYLMEDVKGVKVAIVSYTYATRPYNGTLTLNCNAVEPDTLEKINTFYEGTLDRDLEKINKTVEDAREAGAQIVIAYYHWGSEYQSEPNDMQEEIAQATANMGVDAIFASHPHVVQTVRTITPDDGGHEVPVFYSMGNFISNQQAYLMGNTNSERGILGNISFKWSEEDGITSVKYDYIPFWVDKYYSDGKWHYSIVPLDDSMDDSETLAVSGDVNNAEAALEGINDTLGEDK